MPIGKLKKPRTKERCRAFVGKTISTLMHEGRPQAQAVAISLDVARRSGCHYKRRDAAGHVTGVELAVGAFVVVGLLLLLRPLFKDAEEKHRWSMEHDPAYRRSHQAMEYAEGARGVFDILGGMSSSDSARGNVSGRRSRAPRDHVLSVLEHHFYTSPRYASLDRGKLLMVAVEMLDLGASARDALALTHGLAHDPEAMKKTERLSPKATASAILAGKVRVLPRGVNDHVHQAHGRSAGVAVSFKFHDRHHILGHTLDKIDGRRVLKVGELVPPSRYNADVAFDDAVDQIKSALVEQKLARVRRDGSVFLPAHGGVIDDPADIEIVVLRDHIGHGAMHDHHVYDVTARVPASATYAG